MSAIKKISDNLQYINLKTFLFNLKYLPFKEAIKFPFFLSPNVKLRKKEGKVFIVGMIRPGMIKIGTSEIGHFDKRHNRPVWENSGVIVFNGEALFKYGSKIIVGETGRLELGKKFRLSSGSYIICYKNIHIGNNCRISWDTQVIDTDFHSIFDKSGTKINQDKDILIEDNCWIGNRCTINKGTHLKQYTVVAANSLTNKPYPEGNVIVAGAPAKIIKTEITWGE